METTEVKTCNLQLCSKSHTDKDTVVFSFVVEATQVEDTLVFSSVLKGTQVETH